MGQRDPLRVPGVMHLGLQPFRCRARGRESLALVQPRGTRELVYDRDPDTMRRRAAASTSSACRVNTFVGPQEMAPRQVRLRDEILAISRRHAECLAHIGDMMLSTGRIIEGMLVLGYEARTDKMWSAMSRDVGRLARDPEMVEAMAGPGAARR